MDMVTSVRLCFVAGVLLSTWGVVSVAGATTEEKNKAEEFICNYRTIFNFGDSNSDTGAISAAFYPRPPPNGMTFFHSPAGRVCDGRLVIDFIAKHLGLPYLSPYLDSFQTNFKHGSNFATGGATIRRSNDSLFISGISPFPLDIQAVQFSNFKNRTIALYAAAAKGKSNRNSKKRDYFRRLRDFSASLFVIDIGQNDLAAAFRTTADDKLVRAQIPDMIEQFATAIRFLHQQGAKTFWIHNTGPIGCLPSTLFGVQSPTPPGFLDRNGCIKSQNDVAKEFNARLKQKVVELRAEFSCPLIYVDMYAAKYSLITNAKKEGFYENLKICCGSFKNGIRSYCGNNVLKNGTVVFVEPCKDPWSHISWDGIHYTEGANRWIANKILKGFFTEPRGPIEQACSRFTLFD